MGLKKVEIDNEKVYLKKDFTGWRVVEPVVMKNPETNKLDWKTFNWKNFLSKKGFITLVVLLIILASLYLAFKEQLANYNKVMDNPCAYCKDCQAYRSQLIKNLNKDKIKEIDLSKINITIK